MFIAYAITLVILSIKLVGNAPPPWFVIIPCIILVWLAGLLTSGRLKVKFAKEGVEEE